MAMKDKSWTGLHGVMVLILIAVSLYFLLVEHSDHILPYLPYLILLLCPLMHVFMHQSHGGHGDSGADKEKDAYHRGLEEGKRRSAENNSKR